MWAFISGRSFDEVIQNAANDPLYLDYLRGKIPFGDDQEFWAYAFNVMSSWRLQSQNEIIEWYQDFRAKYMTKEWRIINQLQSRGDAFTAMMLQYLDQGKVDLFMQEFEQNVVPKTKQWLQLLAFVQALEDWVGSPWASTTMLSSIVTQQYYDQSNRAKKQLGLAWNDELPSYIDNQLKDSIARKYAETLFLVDKEKYAQIWMYYLRKTNPNSQELFTKDEWDWKPISFSTWVDPRTDKNSWNTRANQLYLLDTFVKMQVAEGKADSYSMKNWFTTIWMPNSTQARDPKYVELALQWMKDSISYINQSTLSKQDKLNAISWMIVGAMPMLDRMVQDETFKQAVWEDLFSELMYWVYSNSKETSELWQNLAYRFLQEGRYNKPTEKTGTLLDNYSETWNYRGDYYSSGWYSDYLHNKKSFWQVSSFARNKIKFMPLTFNKPVQVKIPDFTPEENALLKSKAQMYYVWAIERERVWRRKLTKVRIPKSARVRRIR